MKPVESCLNRLAAFMAVPALCLVLSLVAGHPAMAFYDFESLSAGSWIDGQDGWEDPTGRTAIIAQDQTLVNGTQVVRPVGVARHNWPALLTRVNDGNFGFLRFSGLERRAILQFDLTAEATAYFALGHDVYGNDLLIPGLGEIGPAFGIYRDPVTGNRFFSIQGADLGTPYDAGLNAGGRCCNSRSDWYRLQLHIDLTANGGEGAASLYYLNLSDGDRALQPIAELQNVPLEMSALDPAAGPSAWDALWLYLQSDGSRVPSADNLGVPRAPAVLQPAGELYLQPVEVFGDAFDAILTLYDNPHDPGGLYWKLGAYSAVRATEPQGASVEPDLDLYLNPVDIFNQWFEVTLEFYDNPRDPHGLYWHYVPGSAMPR